MVLRLVLRLVCCCFGMTLKISLSWYCLYLALLTKGWKREGHLVRLKSLHWYLSLYSSLSLMLPKCRGHRTETMGGQGA